MGRGRTTYTIILHIVVWWIVITVPYLLIRQDLVFTLTFFKGVAAALPYFAFGYVNVYLLVPRALYRSEKVRQVWTYRALTVLAGLGASLLSVAIVRLTGQPTPKITPGALVARRVFVGFVVWGGSSGFGLLRENQQVKRALLEKEKAMLKTELAFLRSQVNPHFLRNVLNSMVLLARKGSGQLEPALGELAGLLDYTLYGSSEGAVSLEEELTSLENYIDLQMLRFGSDVRLQCSLERPRESFLIEPMLLIPLVENAFKHGVGIIDRPEIRIAAAVEQDGIFVLEVRNKYVERPEVGAPGARSDSGIGLSNLRKRLNLIYPECHSLELATEGDWFVALLKIRLA